MTKDIPANSVAVGNPCRVIREINEKDKQYYYKDRKIAENILNQNRGMMEVKLTAE